MTTTVLALALPAAYLSTVCLLRLAVGRCPVWVHGVAVALAAPAHAVISGWVQAAVMVGIGVAVLLVGAVVAEKVISGVGIFAIAVSVMVGPPHVALGLAGGLLLATVVGTVRTVQVAGAARVKDRATATLLAMGLTPAGPGAPNPDYLPQASDVSQIVTTAAQAKKMRLFLPGYLLAGVLAQGALSVLL